MKAAIYSPYLDTFGGGEKYMVTIAESLSTRLEVDILLDNHSLSFGKDKLKSILQERFNLNLSRVNFIAAPMGSGSNFLNRWLFLKKYDLLFYLTDGSIFLSSAKKNILHIQSPLIGQPSTSVWGRIKLKTWGLIIYNSIFTKENSKNNWPLNSQVVYPPVDTEKIRPSDKKKYILSVGRFFGYLKDKKHEFLINAFKNLYRENNLKDWSLHLVGSASEGDLEYLNDLKLLAGDFPVKFYPNLEYESLVRLYGQASIYWHAMGYQEEDPTKMEHFGIATVEAMAGGCVPVVINKGGQSEIVGNSGCGYLWTTPDEFAKFTLNLINDEKLRKQMKEKAVKRANFFNSEKFKESILKLI